MTPQTYIPLMVTPFVAWRVYHRTRHNISRQPVREGRIWWRILVFAAVGLGYGIFTASYPRMLPALIEGIGLGAIVALGAGLPLTRFEFTTEGRFYKPNAYIGVALSILLVGRIAYRIMMLHSAPPDFLEHYPARFQSPLTAFLLGLTAGYYVAYYSGVLVRGRKSKA